MITGGVATTWRREQMAELAKTNVILRRAWIAPASPSAARSESGNAVRIFLEENNDWLWNIFESLKRLGRVLMLIHHGMDFANSLDKSNL